MLFLNELESVPVSYHPMNDIKVITSFVLTDFSNYIENKPRCILLIKIVKENSQAVRLQYLASRTSPFFEVLLMF